MTEEHRAQMPLVNLASYGAAMDVRGQEKGRRVGSVSRGAMAEGQRGEARERGST